MLTTKNSSIIKIYHFFFSLFTFQVYVFNRYPDGVKPQAFADNAIKTSKVKWLRE